MFQIVTLERLERVVSPLVIVIRVPAVISLQANVQPGNALRAGKI